MTEETVLLLASHDYLNYPVVLKVVAALPVTSTLQVTSHRTGVGHVIAANRAPNTVQVKWQPTRPTQTCTSSRAILFWDGTDTTILRSLALIKRAGVPIDIYDPLGNLLDLATFCARLTHNGGNGKMAPAPSAPIAEAVAVPQVSAPQPQTIVDSPSTTESKKRDSKVRLHLHLPEPIYDTYQAQAGAAASSIEKVCADRLRTCVAHTSGRGLYFDDAQRSDLERITGGHLIHDAETALQRVKTTVTLKVGDITVELTDRVLARASSRAKVSRLTLAEYVRKEVIQGLERSVGLRPF